MTLDAFATHEVFNQTPPFVDVNLAVLDRPLLGAVAAFGAAGDEGTVLSHGASLGGAESLELARLANENPPRLKAFDARGLRRDFVEFHPAYHALMRQSIGAGLASSTWQGGAEKASPAAGRRHGSGHVVRTSKHYVTSGVEAGHLCPVTMTHAGIAALAAAPEHLMKLAPLISSRI